MAMALLQHCLGKLIKSNHLAFYFKVVPENSLLVRGKFFSTCRNELHGVTTSEVLAVGQVKGSSGSGRKERNGGKERKRTPHFTVMFVPAIFQGFFPKEAEESTPEQDLVNHIKRSILLMQKGEPQKAERLLHIALKMAQDLKHEKGITYVYDTMANLAFENGEHAKAQKIFVEVLRRLIGSGLSNDDIIVINISLKIADTFLALGDNTKSEQGFLFCLDTLKKKISDGACDENTLILYSQALDRYSLFLLQVKRPNEALKYIETALEVAESLLGDLDNKIGAILLSDMGVIKMATGDKEGSVNCFEKALKIANQEDVDTSVAVIMVNRGIALTESGFSEDGKHWCELGLKNALKEKNNAILKAAEECLKLKSENKQEGRTAV